MKNILKTLFCIVCFFVSVTSIQAQKKSSTKTKNLTLVLKSVCCNRYCSLEFTDKSTGKVYTFIDGARTGSSGFDEKNEGLWKKATTEIFNSEYPNCLDEDSKVKSKFIGKSYKVTLIYYNKDTDWQIKSLQRID
ncbi:hypothetical protein [Parasediminibacterium sp. JCM 36343]|uniref:hypothetical protein n=1 Tax=Parasediminibacterium sp. JCM 36343 TaxID=3374279 RepID=UPI00397B069C